MKKEEYYIDANRIINAIENPKITYLHVSKEYALVEKDYLDELLKDNNGWIKCSDRLPSIGERVLVWGKWHLGSVPVIGAYRGMGVWNSLPKLNEITHWKPLQPPTE